MNVIFLNSFMAEAAINTVYSLSHRAISEALLLIVDFHREVKPQPALLQTSSHPPSLKSGLPLNFLHLPYLNFCSMPYM